MRGIHAYVKRSGGDDALRNGQGCDGGVSKSTPQACGCVPWVAIRFAAQRKPAIHAPYQSDGEMAGYEGSARNERGVSTESTRHKRIEGKSTGRALTSF